jgi:hypothetical protein
MAKAKVKLSLYRPLGLQKVEAPRISKQMVHEDGRVVSSMHWPPLPQKKFLVLISVKAESTPEPQYGWNKSMKNNNDPIGH